jgi:acyl carrier protein
MNLESRVRQLVAGTLKLPVEAIGPLAGSHNVAEWDSLAQIYLVMALEETFNVYIEPENFESLSSVKGIVEFLNLQGLR